MKIKVKNSDYQSVMSLETPKHKKPKRPNMLFRTLMKVLSMPELWATNFRCERIGMERLGKREPCLYLMNHSSFTDLKIASSLIYPRPVSIVCTVDALIGKEWLMRQIGCIPTHKFVFDIGLIRDIKYSLNENKCSVLMYPEAGYSFDGRSTVLPDNFGKFIKMLGVPVVMIRADGAFLRNPLYNNLKIRKVDVSAKMKLLFDAEEIKNKSEQEIGEAIQKEFSFDNFKAQQENKIKVDEPFRAESLNRLLYKCPHCEAEGKTLGEGTELRCLSCGKAWELDEYGFMRAKEGETEFSHIPDWYDWERECVKREIEAGSYSLQCEVDIYLLVNSKCLYRVGDGVLKHNNDGFNLEGCGGELSYSQKPISLYSLNADYFWYEIGDIICIGDAKTQYYCFPKDSSVSVTKARLATEEMYKLVKKASRGN